MTAPLTNAKGSPAMNTATRKQSPLLERLSRMSARDRAIKRGTRASTQAQVLVAIAVTLLVWVVLARVIDSQLLFPGPLTTWSRFIELLWSGQIFGAISVSGLRILAGFAIGGALGVCIGFLTAGSRLMAAVLDPFVHFLRFIPPIVWFGPMLLLFGSGESSKVVLVVYTTFFIVAISTAAGAQSVPRNIIRASQSFGAGRLTIFRRVVLPGSAGQIFVGLRIAMGNSFMTIVVAEMLGADQGIGYLITNGTLSVDTSVVFVGAAILGLGGIAADRTLEYFVNRFGARYMETN